MWLRANNSTAGRLCQWRGQDTPDTRIARFPFDEGLRFKDTQELLNSHLHVLGTLRRVRLDLGKDPFKLPERGSGVADFHRPDFAHTAQTSSSVANSARSTSTSANAREDVNAVQLIACQIERDGVAITAAPLLSWPGLAGPSREKSEAVYQWMAGSSPAMTGGRRRTADMSSSSSVMLVFISGRSRRRRAAEDAGAIA
jgi:hypothetical protein